MADKEFVYSREVERKIGAESTATLAKLEQGTTVDRERAQSMRQRLYSWLMRVGDLVTKPSLAVGGEVAAMLDEELQTNLSKIDTPEAGAVLDAWGKLPDDVALKLVGQLVSKLYTSSPQGLLVSRQHPSRAWMATGFHYDRGMRAVCATVGNEHAEPIGFDDDVHFVPTAGSKTLWAREWAMAVLLPFSPAFKADELAAPQEVGDALALSDRERTIMANVINMLDDDLRVWRELAAEAQTILKLPASKSQEAARANKNRRDEHVFKMREGVNFAGFQLPRVDQYLATYATDHPEVGVKFANVAPEDYVRVVREFLQRRLDNDRARRLIEGPALAIPEDGIQPLPNQLHTRLKALLALPEAEQDGDEMNSVLSGARSAIPALHHALTEYEQANPEVTADVGAKWVLDWLAGQLKPV